MECRFTNLNQRARDHEALLGFRKVLKWFDVSTYEADNKAVV